MIDIVFGLEAPVIGLEVPMIGSEAFMIDAGAHDWEAHDEAPMIGQPFPSLQREQLLNLPPLESLQSG